MLAQPCVQFLAQGNFDTRTGGVMACTAVLLISGRSTLPHESQFATCFKLDSSILDDLTGLPVLQHSVTGETLFGSSKAFVSYSYWQLLLTLTPRARWPP